MTAVSAILLAAGESRRMCGVNKLELPIGGMPLLRRTVTTLLAAPIEELVVVLGHEAAKAGALLRGLPVATVFNECYPDGQMTSVYKGLNALTRRCDGVLVCLTDQPLLQPADIETIIDAFGRRSRGTILVPTYQGKRGNPIVLDLAHREEILRSGRNLGCKHLMERNPELVETVEMPTDHVVVDLDTPEDYAELQRRCTPPWERPATARG